MAPSTLIVALALAAPAVAWVPTSVVSRSAMRTTVPRRTTASMSLLLAQETGKSAIDPTVFQKYLDIPIGDCKQGIMAEYCWIDADGGVRSKTRTLPKSKLENGAAGLPEWNYDGSSTGQAPGDDSEVIMIPRAVYRDPFRLGENVLVMCDTQTPAGEPLPTNSRASAAATFAAHEDEVPWFGLEQEYTLFNLDQVTPLGWPKGGFPGPQGPYYCGAGPENAFGRAVSDAHYRACLFAGLKISGTNAEVMPGQWEYQVGPCIGIESGDMLSMSRYILNRVCENYDTVASLDPKPVPGDWNGAGCHTNFSTAPMRVKGGLAKIVEAIEKLGLRHKEHMAAYGEGNEKRMTGGHETADYDNFSYGVANRGASVRIGNETQMQGFGYFEDRRPASNMDPYVVTGMVYESTCLL